MIEVVGDLPINDVLGRAIETAAVDSVTGVTRPENDVVDVVVDERSGIVILGFVEVCL